MHLLIRNLREKVSQIVSDAGPSVQDGESLAGETIEEMGLPWYLDTHMTVRV